MKKKLLPIMLLAFLGISTLVGCNNNAGGSQGGGGGGEDNPPVVETVDVTGVSLNKTEVSLVKGATETLTATVAPDNATDKSVSWKTSDSSVATVSNGVITAVDVGSAVITVTTTDGGYAAKCNVSVTLHFEELTIANKAEFAEGMLAGSNKALSITTNPECNLSDMLSKGYLSITSSDNEVAVARGMNVYAMGAGTATISVELFNVSDEFELTVEAKPTNKDLFGTDHDGTLEDPFTNEDALKAAKYLEANGGFGTAEYYFKGEVETFYHAPGSRDDGVVSWFMKPAQEGGEKFEIYKCLGADGKTPLGKTDIWKGAVVTAHGPFAVYKGQYETSYAVFDKAEGDKPVDPVTIEATVAETISAGLLLADGDQSWDTYVITGYVVKKSGSNFFLADTKDADVSDDKALFELYGVEEKDQESLLKGAKVKVTCEIKNYHGQIENGTKPVIELLEAGEAWEVPQPVEENYVRVDTPVKDVTYKIGLATKASDVGSDLFFTAALNESGYGLTSNKFAEGAEFQLVEVDGGFNLKVMGETVKYVNFVANGTGKAKLEIADAASSVFTYNADAKTLVASVDGTDFYMGTYTSKGTTYQTLSVSKLQYITGEENVGKIDVSQFPVHFYEEDTSGGEQQVDYRIVNAPAQATNYKIGIATAGSDIGADLFFTAALNDSSYGLTANKFVDGADFQLVEVEGGYNLKIVGETVQYVNFIANGTGKAKLEISDTASSVFTFNSDARTLVAAVDGTNFYMGTYTSKGTTYQTLSVSKLDYISGANAEKVDVSQFPAHLYEEGKAAPVTLTGIALNKESAELEAGDTLTLTASPVPAYAELGEVTWESSNNEVATVVDGVVTAVAAGNATITAKVGDLTATCVLTITSAVTISDFVEDQVIDLSVISSADADLGTSEITDLSKIQTKLNSSAIKELSGSKVYAGNSGQGPKVTGIKLGTGSAAGSLTVKLTGNAKRLVLTGYAWSSSKLAEVSVNGSKVYTFVAADATTAKDIVVDFAEATNEITFSASMYCVFTKMVVGPAKAAADPVDPTIRFFYDGQEKCISGSRWLNEGYGDTQYFPSEFDITKLTYTVEPEGADVAVSWTIDDAPVAAPTSNPLAAGTYALTVTVTANEVANAAVVWALFAIKSVVLPESMYTTGTFFKAIELNAGGVVPFFLTFSNDGISARFNGQAEEAISVVSYSDESKQLVLHSPTFGDFGMLYDEANAKFTNLTLTGDYASLLKYNSGETLFGHIKYWNCDGTTDELKGQFNRRYGNPWNLDTGNDDRVTSNSEFAKYGNSLRLRPYKDDRFALATKDFAEAFNARNLSFWVYNSGETDVTIQAFAYKSTGYNDNITAKGNTTLAAGQWTFVSGGFSAADFYAFQIFVAKTSCVLYFDDIVLF